MHKRKDHADGEFPNFAKFVALLWKVGAKVSGEKTNLQSARRKNIPNFALKKKKYIYIFFVFGIL